MTYVEGQSGRFTIAAPTGGLTNRVPAVLTDLVVVPVETKAATERCVVERPGLLKYTGAVKKGADGAWTLGEKLYYDTTAATGGFTKTAGSLKAAGFAAAAATSGATEADVLIGG